MYWYLRLSYDFLLLKKFFFPYDNYNIFYFSTEIFPGAYSDMEEEEEEEDPWNYDR